MKLRLQRRPEEYSGSGLRLPEHCLLERRVALRLASRLPRDSRLVSLVLRSDGTVQARALGALVGVGIALTADNDPCAFESSPGGMTH